MAGVTLRIVSSRVPYRRAGVNFEPTGHKMLAVTLIDLGELDEARLGQLLSDPHLDVTAGNGLFFGPVGSVDEALDLAAMLEEPAPARGTEQVLADHARMEAERERDAALAGGDDEKTGTEPAAPVAAKPDPEVDPAAGAAPPEAAASGEDQAETAADAPGASAVTPSEPKPKGQQGGKK